MSKGSLAASLVASSTTNLSVGYTGNLNAVTSGRASNILGDFSSWLSGQQDSNPLPRPLADFMSGSFGPMAPMIPFGIDAPAPSGRPGPRRQQYDVGYDLPRFPGQGKLAGFSELKLVSETYSVVRAAMNIRIRELCGLDWDIVPTPDAHEDIRGNKAMLADFKDRRDIALQFWRRPDPEYDSYISWLAAGLEDLFVYDAWALYLQPTRLPGKGPFGSDLAALALLDGSTIYPLVNIKGATPRPPAPAYQQYLHGAPRVDLMTTMCESDDDRFAELGVSDDDYAGDQLMYRRYYRRASTMYGFSPIEQALTAIRTGIKFQEFQLDFFTEGSMPGLIVVCPPQYSPTQVRQLQDVLNMASGDVGQKWKIRCLPGGETKVEQMKPADMQEKASQGIVEQVLMILDVKPLEVGMLPGGRTSGMGGSAMHEQQASATKRTATRPLAKWLEAQHDHIIQEVWGQTDMRFTYVGLEEKDDNYQKAQTDQIYVGMGGFTLNDLRKELDMEPYSIAEADEPIIITQTGVQTLSTALQSGNMDLQSKQLGIQSQQQLLAHPELRAQGPPGAKQGAPPANKGQQGASAAKPAPSSAAAQSKPDSAPAQANKAAAIEDLEEDPADIDAWLGEQLAELQAYKRYRAKGHTRPFEFAHLTKSVSAGDVDMVEVEWALKATAAKRRYVQDAVKRVGGQIQDHVDDLVNGQIDAGTFVDRAHQTMHGAFTRAYRSGARAVSPAYQLSEDDRKLVEQLANAQRPYLDNFAQAAMTAGKDASEWTWRSQLYGAATSGVWEQGRAAGKTDSYGEDYQGRTIVTWHARADACPACAAMDGQSWDLEDVAEWPGDLHPRCKCSASYRRAKRPAAGAQDAPDLAA